MSGTTPIIVNIKKELDRVRNFASLNGQNISGETDQLIAAIYELHERISALEINQREK